MARSTVWLTCCVVARGIEVGSTARAGRERQSPRRNHANEDVRAMDRSPRKKNVRRRIGFYSATAGPAKCLRDCPLRGGRVFQWHHFLAGRRGQLEGDGA